MPNTNECKDQWNVLTSVSLWLGTKDMKNNEWYFTGHLKDLVSLESKTKNQNKTEYDK